jgi:hypothetical protein
MRKTGRRRYIECACPTSRKRPGKQIPGKKGAKIPPSPKEGNTEEQIHRHEFATPTEQTAVRKTPVFATFLTF